MGIREDGEAMQQLALMLAEHLRHVNEWRPLDKLFDIQEPPTDPSTIGITLSSIKPARPWIALSLDGKFITEADHGGWRVIGARELVRKYGVDSVRTSLCAIVDDLLAEVDDHVSVLSATVENMQDSARSLRESARAFESRATQKDELARQTAVEAENKKHLSDSISKLRLGVTRMAAA